MSHCHQGGSSRKVTPHLFLYQLLITEKDPEYALNNFRELFLVAMYGGAELNQNILKKAFHVKEEIKCNMINAEKAFQFIIENPEIFQNGIQVDLDPGTVKIQRNQLA